MMVFWALVLDVIWLNFYKIITTQTYGFFYYGVICAHFYKTTTTLAKAPFGCGGGLG
jgi:hypothetical protein